MLILASQMNGELMWNASYGGMSFDKMSLEYNEESILFANVFTPFFDDLMKSFGQSQYF